MFVAGVFGVRAGGTGRSSQMSGEAGAVGVGVGVRVAVVVVVAVAVAVAVAGDVRATGLQFLLCMFSLFFVFLQTEKTFL